MAPAKKKESNLPVHVVLDFAEAAADMLRLLSLDAAWTGVAERRGEFTERDREALVTLGRKIDAEVAVVERHAATLARTCESYRTVVNERIASALTSDRFSTSQREDVRRILGVEGDDFAGRGIALGNSLAQRASAAREELRDKVSGLRSNSPPVTDLSHEFVCNVAAGAFVAGAIACPGTAGLGCIEAAFAFGFAVGYHC